MKRKAAYRKNLLLFWLLVKALVIALHSALLSSTVCPRPTPKEFQRGVQKSNEVCHFCPNFIFFGEGHYFFCSRASRTLVTPLVNYINGAHDDEL